jgi:hypothetical protein
VRDECNQGMMGEMLVQEGDRRLCVHAVEASVWTDTYVQ